MKKLMMISLFIMPSFLQAKMYEISDYELSSERASLLCEDGEILEREFIGRYCIFRDPQTSVCMAWENLFRERCVLQESFL